MTLLVKNFVRTIKKLQIVQRKLLTMKEPTNSPLKPSNPLKKSQKEVQKTRGFNVENGAILDIFNRSM